MNLPLFGLEATDPAAAPPGPRPPGPRPPGPRQVSLVRLAGEIARCVAAIGKVAVEGEVHRPAQSRRGWVFFTLRDRAAEIKVAVPRPALSRCRVVGGERVCVVGALEWGNDRGSLQLRADEVTPVGAGAIAAMLAEVRRSLVADGLVDRPRRRLPRLPRAIGVVCGADAAVRADIESVCSERFAGYPLVVSECSVSGPGAAVAIVAALDELSRQPGVDVVILARGGGDATALLPWSDEGLCRAVAACPVPVVSAIGHDGDRPLCDDVADLRCGTPSIAAQAVVPDRSALLAHLDRARQRGADALGQCCQRASGRLAAVSPGPAVAGAVTKGGQRLAWAGRDLAAAHPRRRLAECRGRLARIDWRRPAGERIGAARGRLYADGRHLRALSPQHVLERGYAVVRQAGGAVVRRADQVHSGEALHIVLAAGRLAVRVERRSDDGSA
ncbi:MAG: exodeoxyribonuclease VII large subunit [Acidimicrobiales bacterium]